jgi:hypothetical protein
MSLIVDHTVPDSRTTHNGNFACHFFKNLSLFSVITGINNTIIAHFLAILQALSSDFPIGNETFDRYAKETIILYLQDFG